MFRLLQAGQTGRSIISANITFELFIILDSVLILSCESIVTLKAVIAGNIPPGTTYEWEQLSGDSVTWLESKYQPIVMFQQPITGGGASRTDKIFRFYVNKGTNSEQYKDILVSSIPREFFVQSVDTIKQGISNNYVELDETTSDLQIVPGISPADTATTNNQNIILLWKNPLYYNSGYQKSYVVERVLPFGNTIEYDVGNTCLLLNPKYNTSYKIMSIVGVYNIPRYTQSNWISYVPNNSVTTIDASDISLIFQNPELWTSGNLSKLEVLERQRVDLIENEPDILTIDSSYSSLGIMSVIEVLQRDLTAAAADEPDVLTIDASYGSIGSQIVLEVKTIGLTTIG